jgi:hypothetical protein
MAPIFNMEIFLVSFLGALVFIRNFKKVKFLHILEEQTQKKIKKNCWQKNLFKMAAKFKMATKTKFAFVPKRTLVRLWTYGLFNYAIV